MKPFLLIPLFLLPAACSSPSSDTTSTAEVKEIRANIEVIEDGDLLIRKKTDTSSSADSVVEKAYFKDQRLIKYEQGVYKNDTCGMVRFYFENDSLIFSEDYGTKGKDTLQFTRLYFRHGACIRSEGAGKTDPKYTFFAGQAIIGLHKKQSGGTVN